MIEIGFVDFGHVGSQTKTRIEDQRVEARIHIEEDGPDVFDIHVFKDGHQNLTGEILESSHGQVV